MRTCAFGSLSRSCCPHRQSGPKLVCRHNLLLVGPPSFAPKDGALVPANTPAFAHIDEGSNPTKIADITLTAMDGTQVAFDLRADSELANRGRFVRLIVPRTQLPMG